MGKDLKGRNLGKGFCQRKDKRYMFRYVDPWGDRITLYGHNINQLKREAKEEKRNAELKFALEVKTSKTPIITRKDKKKVQEELREKRKNEKTVEEWFNDYVDYKENVLKIKKSTLASYYIHFGKMKKFWDKPMSELKLSDINGIILKITKEKQKNGINYFITFVKTFLKYAYDNGCENLNFFNKIQKVKKEKTTREAICQKDYQTLVEFASSKEKFIELKNAIVLAYNTGLRAGEVSGLTFDDIDFERGILSVNKQLRYINVSDGNTSTKSMWLKMEPKTKTSYRKVPLNEEAIKVLKEQLIRREKLHKKGCWSNLVFQSNALKKGEAIPLDCTRQFTYLKSEIKKERIPLESNDITFHCLRHTFSSNAIANGVPAIVVQKIMGHSDLLMTNHYTHMTDENAINEFRKIQHRI